MCFLTEIGMRTISASSSLIISARGLLAVRYFLRQDAANQRAVTNRKNMKQSDRMLNSIINPEPENPATRRRMFQVAGFSAILLSALLAMMIVSFVGILPNWVGWTANLAIA
jgi:ferric-dicitrate binding protein FerR (iron transport regulator)